MVIPGQALVVNSAGTLPEWGYVGQIDQVYYVSPDGTDVPAPDGGVTLDRAWRSIRYALHQMDKGPRNPQAVNLLERNKAFIQDETIAWINAQIAGAISPFTGAFTYNATKCRRDIGILIEATLHDLRHGGNRKSRMAALSYFTPAGASYVTGQTDETAAAIVRAAYIAQQVVANNTSYSPSQGTTLQVSDLTKVAEAGTSAQIETLMTLSSNAITAGNVTSVPAEVYPNTTLNVKTGTYEEILPMSVKERCAVVGDELRSTNIRPAGAIVNTSDVQYSLQGIQRMEAIIGDVIQNNAVTVTPAGGTTGLTPTAGTVLGLNDVTGTSVATTTTGSGTGLQVTIVCNAFQSYSSITITQPGQGYAVNDTITIPSATSCNANSNNAATPLGADVVLTVTGVTSGNLLVQNTAVPAGSAAAASAATTLADNIEKYIDFKINANGAEPAMTGSNIPNTTAGYTDARLRLLANREFIAREVSEYVKRQNPTLNFNQTNCEDDVKDYVDGIMHDLYYTGNYESLKGAKWYVNSVQGSTTKDMFYMRNATGLRNCTLQGLSGTLGSANSYGTKRPTAGAFVSLDPGFGPNDYRTWIATTQAGTGQFTPTDGTYDPATGTTVLTIGAHQLQPGDTVRLTTASLRFHVLRTILDQIMIILERQTRRQVQN